MSLLEELYRETIMIHAQKPHNFGALANPTVESRGHNTSCGDMITIYLQSDGERIADVSFQGQGCAISQSSASMMTDLVKGRSFSEARELIKKFKEMVVEGKEAAPELGDLRALAGVSKLHSRVKCATLAWNALEQALVEAQNK